MSCLITWDEIHQGLHIQTASKELWWSYDGVSALTIFIADFGVKCWYDTKSIIASSAAT
jgi:lipid-A-disaccharide synthase-like uncharacterized protein